MQRYMVTRTRFFIYVQLTVFFLAAIYLLSRHDRLLVPTSWGIPYKSVDPLPVEADGASPPSTGGPGPGYKVSDLPPSVPKPQSPDDGDGPDKTLPSPDESSREDEHGSEKPHSSVQEPPSSPTSPPTSSATSSPVPTKEELMTKARGFIPSILDANDTSIDRMFCPPINSTRYSYLKPSRQESKPKYFFALNLRECVDLLPRLLGSLVEAIDFLGPEHCAVSIVEGNSDDGTLEVLEVLEPELQRMGAPYYLRSTPLNPKDGDRIGKLAMLRAMALWPITGTSVPDNTTDPAAGTTSSPSLQLAKDATVVFVNDVAACAEDLLELLHQRRAQDADMTCAMDWHHPGPDPLFYDVWVARALNGDLFFDIPAATGSWDNAKDLFWNEPVARARLAAHRPFQVFACWNGAVAFDAAPVVSRDVAFRRSREGECFQGEPQLFCKDLWYKGYGKIAVVPSVNLEYTDQQGRRVKKEKGYVSDLIADEAVVKNGTGLRVPWKLDPPETVKCMPDFVNQKWLPWNESLPLV